MSFFQETSADGADYQRLRDIFGFIPRVFRVQARAPEAIRPQALLLEALLGNEACLTRRQKEEILLSVAAARRSPSGIALHQQMLRLLGASEREISTLTEGVADGSPLLTFARDLALQPGETDQRAIEALRQQGFSEPQVVETILLAGMGAFLATMQFGTGAVPDFAVQPLSPRSETNIPHPEATEHRPNVEDQDDPDAEIVRRVKAGDLDAFAALVNRHSQRVYRALAALLGNQEEARDALQDTFLKAFRSLPAFAGRSRFSSWLLSIAQNTGVQRLRDRKAVEPIDDPGPEEEFRPLQIRAWDDNPEQLYSKAEIRAKVERAIASLPAPYRVVLILRDVEQVSTKEAADVLGLSIPALKARLNRGRLMLREALTPYFSRGATAP